MIDPIHSVDIPQTNLKEFQVGQRLYYTAYHKTDPLAHSYTFWIERYGKITKLNPDGGFEAEMEFHTKAKIFIYNFTKDELTAPLKGNFVYVLTTYNINKS